MQEPAALLSLFDLTIHRPRDGEPIFEKAELALKKSTWHEIIGPAASGKSLLYDVITLTSRPTDASCVFMGRNLDRTSRRKTAALRRDIGSADQRPLFLEDRSVIENLALPFVVRRQKDKALAACESILENTKLAHLSNVEIRALSYQERRVVGLLRAIVGYPLLIAIDGGMDDLEESHASRIFQQLRHAHQRGSAIVIFGTSASPHAHRGQKFMIEDRKIHEVIMPKRTPRVPEREVFR